MPRPKRRHVLTFASAHSAAAFEEWQAGIEEFIAWANRARTGETSQPAAVQCNEALTAFSAGRFDSPFSGLSIEAVVAGIHVLRLVRDCHWHLQLFPFCEPLDARQRSTLHVLSTRRMRARGEEGRKAP